MQKCPEDALFPRKGATFGSLGVQGIGGTKTALNLGY
jgi:hypothetical protein